MLSAAQRRKAIVAAVERLEAQGEAGAAAVGRAWLVVHDLLAAAFSRLGLGC